MLCKCGKIPFRSRAQAKRYLKRIEAQRRTAKRVYGPVPARIYQCSASGAWHMASGGRR